MTIDFKSPFQIKAITDNENGYESYYCLECRVGENAFQNTPLVVIASKKFEKFERCSSYIKSISSLGIMEIEFSEPMKTNLTMDKLNTTFIDIFITPYRDNEIDDFRNLNLTWNATKFENYTLLIQLNFSNPLMISDNIIYDNITFHVINETEIFVSERGLMLDEDSKRMNSVIDK